MLQKKDGGTPPTNSSIKHSAAAGQHISCSPLSSSLAPRSRQQEPQPRSSQPRRSLPPLQRSPAGARLPRKARPSLRASSRESAPAVSSLSLPPPCPPRQRSRLSRTDFPLPPLHSYLQRVSKTIFISLEGRREKIINPFLAFTFSTAISGCVFSARRIISLLSKIRGPAATRSRPAPSLAARRPQRSTVLPAALKAVLNKGPSATRNHACPPGITAR